MKIFFEILSSKNAILKGLFEEEKKNTKKETNRWNQLPKQQKGTHSGTNLRTLLALHFIHWIAKWPV